jgi:hypothetical protein
MSTVFRVNKTKDYTMMANHHLRNRNLSLRAKGLHSLMLSLPESWDYSLVGLSKISKEGVSAISSALKELEQEGYLVRQRQRNEIGHMTGTEYVIYEKPLSQPPKADSPKQENPMLENPHVEKPYAENRIQSNTNKSSTKELTINPSIKLIRADTIDRQAITEVFKDNIAYNALCHTEQSDTLDELLEVLVDTYCSTDQTIRISNKEIPIQTVRGRLMKLTMDHIQYVVYSFAQNTTKVRNIKAYLLACLYNAPSTIHHYYQAEVAHDLYGTQGATD